MRRGVVGLLVLVLTYVGVIACGTPSEGPAASSSASAAGEGAVSYPLTLRSEFGETVLRQRPQRIAVVTANTVDTDALVALGVTPVLAPATVSRNPWLPADTVAKIPQVWKAPQAGADVPLETVAAARPDLILALSAPRSFTKDRFDKLAAIAPVLFAKQGDLSWQDVTDRVGEALDLKTAARERIDAVTAGVAKVAAEHPQFRGRSAAHLIVYAQQFGAQYVSQPDRDSARLFTMLGFTVPADADRYPKGTAVSSEEIGNLQADFLLVNLTRPQDEVSYFLDSSAYKSIPAVREGHAVVNPPDPKTGSNNFAWGLSQQSVLAVPWLIDSLAEQAASVLG